MASVPARPSQKLFHVLVAGGIAMATPACSSDPAQSSSDSGASDGSTGSADAGDAASDSGSPTDAAGNRDVADTGISDALAAADACLNRPGDCSHGLCSW